jgi:signal transduction histidine kinase
VRNSQTTTHASETLVQRERINLAEALHDGPIQESTVVALLLDQLAYQIERGEIEQTQATIAQLRENVHGQMTSLRLLMVELQAPRPDLGES